MPPSNSQQPHRQFVRRNRVDERVAAVIAVVAGAATVPAGARPTGSPVWDVVLTGLAVAALTWAGASASWWTVAAFAGLVAALTLSPVPTVIAAVATFGALWVGVRRRDLAEVRALATALAANAALWSTLADPLWLVPLLIVPAGIGLAVHGVLRRRRPVRRVALWVGGGAAAAVFVATALFGIVGSTARTALVDGNALTRSGIDALDTGQYELATTRLTAAADRLDQAERLLDGAWTRPARLVPVIGQHQRAAAVLAREAASGVREAADALDQVDVDALRLVDGRIDLAGIASVEAPLRQVDTTLAGLAVVLDDIDSHWLIGPVRSRVTGLQDDIVRNADRLEVAIDAVGLAPHLLGGEGERRYLIMFTTPVEARGVGGFPGNYAEISAVDGRISLVGFGRFSDLDREVFERGARCDACPAGFVERYGRFGFTTGPDGAVGSVPWKNITMAAHYPYVAETAVVLHAQSGRTPVDGMVLMDTYVVEQFVAYTGPVEVAELDVIVDEESLLPFLLFEQYLGDDNVERIDALDEIGNAVISRLLTQPLPPPPDLARDLGPLVGERRLLFWTDDPAEQELLDRVGLLGGLPTLDPDAPAGFSVAVNNGGGNKIDAFLEVDVELSLVSSLAAETGVADVDGSAADDGVRPPSDQLVARVTLTNTAPTGGLPRYIIGNSFDLPLGTNRMFLTFFGPPGLTGATRDGEVLGLEPGREAGWEASSAFLDIDPGATTVIELTYRLAEPLESLDDVVTWTQPLVRSRTDLGPLAPPVP